MNPRSFSLRAQVLRIINVDRNNGNPPAVEALKMEFTPPFISLQTFKLVQKPI